MKKSELLASVAADAGTSKVVTERVINAYYRAVVRALRHECPLTVAGFGTYTVNQPYSLGAREALSERAIRKHILFVLGEQQGKKIIDDDS
ncbi:HU family DNA-binding protein [Enterobacter asburiae]